MISWQHSVAAGSTPDVRPYQEYNAIHQLVKTAMFKDTFQLDHFILTFPHNLLIIYYLVCNYLITSPLTLRYYGYPTLPMFGWFPKQHNCSIIFTTKISFTKATRTYSGHLGSSPLDVFINPAPCLVSSVFPVPPCGDVALTSQHFLHFPCLMVQYLNTSRNHLYLNTFVNII